MNKTLTPLVRGIAERAAVIITCAICKASAKMAATLVPVETRKTGVARCVTDAVKSVIYYERRWYTGSSNRAEDGLNRCVFSQSSCTFTLAATIAWRKADGSLVSSFLIS